MTFKTREVVLLREMETMVGVCPRWGAAQGALETGAVTVSQIRDFSVVLGWGGHSWRVRLRMCRWGPTECGDTSHLRGGQQWAPSASQLPLWEGENTGLFWLKARFQYTHTKEARSLDLLLLGPRNGVGEHDEWVGKEQPHSPPPPPSQVTVNSLLTTGFISSV